MQPDPRFDFQLDADLAAAGAIARSAADQAPAPAFAYGLRSQLLTAHAAAGAAGATRSLPRRSRFSRFAPVFAMMLALALATVVAAGAFRLFGPRPTPPPAPTPPAVVTGLAGGATFTPTAEPHGDRVANADAEPNPDAESHAHPDADSDSGADARADAAADACAHAAADARRPPRRSGRCPSPSAGCPGGVVIGWSPISDPTFAKYRTLRSASAGHPRGLPAAGRRRGSRDGQVGDDERRQRL